MPTDMHSWKDNHARADDGEMTSALPSRSERFFKLADDWYFTTRENVTMGPFESLELAQHGVASFISFIQLAPSKLVEVFKGY